MPGRVSHRRILQGGSAVVDNGGRLLPAGMWNLGHVHL